MMKDNNAKNWLTVGELVTRLQALMASGEISRDSIVVGLADEFNYFYPYESGCPLKFSLKEEIEDAEHMVEYYDKLCRNDSMAKAQEKADFYKKLESRKCIFLRNSSERGE